tara:strand:+ start:372 stop:1139 length:768 start_codon:yes stop_codon:yes gene_type:complete
MNLLSNNNNKEILWNALYSNQIFNNIPNTMLNDVKTIFENNINQIESNLSIKQIDQQKLLELNKIILKNISNDISLLKKSILPQNNEKTKTSYINERQQEFNNKFQETKNDFDNLINQSKPEEINFKEDLDSPLETNEMNNILQKLQQQRNNVVFNIDNSNNISTNKSESYDLSLNIIDLSNQPNLLKKEVDNKKPEKKKISNLDDLLKNNIENNLKMTPINTKNDNQIILDRLNKLEDIMFVIIEKLNKIDSKF